MFYATYDFAQCHGGNCMALGARSWWLAVYKTLVIKCRPKKCLYLTSAFTVSKPLLLIPRMAVPITTRVSVMAASSGPLSCLSSLFWLSLSCSLLGVQNGSSAAIRDESIKRDHETTAAKRTVVSTTLKHSLPQLSFLLLGHYLLDIGRNHGRVCPHRTQMQVNKFHITPRWWKTYNELVSVFLIPLGIKNVI